jgi:hypothetical protein
MIFIIICSVIAIIALIGIVVFAVLLCREAERFNNIIKQCMVDEDSFDNMGPNKIIKQHIQEDEDERCE